MVERKYGAEGGRDERVRRRLQVLYASQTREKQIFIEDLKEYRRCKSKELLNSLVIAVGPKWYQALSVQQRTALDSLQSSMYQDLLEGRPVRSAVVMHRLGLVPSPSNLDLMNCVILGNDDPKEMLAQLYFTMYGYGINGKRTSYCVNARLVLSAIYYLGLDNLLLLLEKTFAPDTIIAKPEIQTKRTPSVKMPSPYLAKMVAVLYEPPRPRRMPPPPLPDLSVLNVPYVEEPIMQKPPPPPPPPPPPKKRFPISYCEKLAGINRLVAAPASVTNILSGRKSIRSRGRLRSKANLLVNSPTKKKYGIGIQTQKKNSRRKRPVPPTTGLWNAQYTINGVFLVGGKTCYVLGNVTILPSQGELIHGGHAFVGGLFINIHCGYRGRAPDQKPDPCDCVSKWQEATFKYIKSTKCDCDHYYDFDNEGRFSQEELPYFTKPSGYAPFKFHYDTIFDLDEQRLHVEKEFRKIWEAESTLRVDGGDPNKSLDKKKKSKKTEKDPKKSDGSAQADDDMGQTCLGMHPKITDYLKCALQLMRKVNVAARLPDLHFAPELKEWMRQRLYGKLTGWERKEYLRKSTTYWRMFSTLAEQGYGHVPTPNEPLYRCATTWRFKQSLNDHFKQYTNKYKLAMYKSHAYVSNLLWRTMYQAEFPDKKFREIYFSYLFGTVEDIQLIHPYSQKESSLRKSILSSKRYICLPPGYEPKT